MKRWNNLYEYCRLPIRVLLLSIVLIGFGYLIQDVNVNIFYTFKNPLLLLISETSSRIGHFIFINIPFVFLVNLVAKRANSGAPTVFAIVGYFTFLIFTMMFNTHTMPNEAYNSILGISYNHHSYGVIYPIQTGLIGAFVVAYLTRFSYLHSRRRSAYSFLSFLDKDSAGLVYNIVLCAIAGSLFAALWPIGIDFLEKVINWIASDLSDPLKLSVYGFFDRAFAILGLSSLIRKPFWYGKLGGNYLSVSGETILGDVNIWRYMPEASATFSGAGRFITPYYVINMFAVPAVLLAMFFINTDKNERHRGIMFTLVTMIASFVCGNPLPLELMLLFTAPLLLLFHLLFSGALFGILFKLNAFLGFEYSGSVTTAMPGAFPDFIINARNPFYIRSLLIIILVGIIVAIVYYLATYFYFHYLAFDITGSHRAHGVATRIVDAVGGVKNITKTYSSALKLSLEVEDLEKVSYDKLKKINSTRITETKTRIIINFGSSSTIIRTKIDQIIKKSKR